MELTEKLFPELKDNSKRSRIVISIFLAICVINIVASISIYFQIEMLKQIQMGVIPGEDEISMNDTRQQIISITQSIIYLISMVLFLNWMRRAYGNLKRIGENTEYAESMAIWSFVIPFVNLFRPYTITKEIAEKTNFKLKEVTSDFSSTFNLSFVGLWWGLFLLSNILGRFVLKSVFQEETVEHFIFSSELMLVSNLFDILAAVVTLVMINRISITEVLLFEKNRNPSTDLFN